MTCRELVPEHSRGVGIFAECAVVSSSEDLEHPVMEVIHGMIGNRAEAPVIFLTSLVEIHTKSLTNVFILATGLNVFGPQ